MKGCWYNEDGQDHDQSAVIGHKLNPRQIRECYEDYGDPVPLPWIHEKHTKQKSQHIYTTIRTNGYSGWKKEMGRFDPGNRIDRNNNDGNGGGHVGNLPIGDSSRDGSGNEEQDDGRAKEEEQGEPDISFLLARLGVTQ